MTIQTDYGMVEYEESDLLIFPDGLFGFPKLTQYLLLYLNEDDDSMLLLQSVEECIESSSSFKNRRRYFVSFGKPKRPSGNITRSSASYSTVP